MFSRCGVEGEWRRGGVYRRRRGCGRPFYLLDLLMYICIVYCTVEFGVLGGGEGEYAGLIGVGVKNVLWWV